MSALTDAVDELIAHPDRPPSSIEALQDRARTHRRRRTRWLVAGAAGLVCGVAIAGALAATSTNDRARIVAGEDRPATGAALRWTKGPFPGYAAVRIVRTTSGTYVVGTTDRYAPAIWRQTTAGSPGVIAAFSGTPDGRTTLNGPWPQVADLAQRDDVLVAAGQAFVTAGAREGAAIWRSRDDGRTWHEATVEQPREFAEPVPVGTTVASSTINRVLYADGRWYAFGGSWASTETSPGAGTFPTSCRPLVWTSTDGSRWSLAKVAATAVCESFVDATVGPAGLIALGDRRGAALRTGEVWRSEDGTWTPQARTGDPLHEVTGLASGPAGYVVVGAFRGDGAIWTSPDARVWTRAATARPSQSPGPSPTTGATADRGEAEPQRAEESVGEATFTGIARSGDRWLAVGWQSHPGRGEPFTDTLMWSSTDGTTWSPVASDELTFVGPVGPTADGFMITAQGNISGDGSLEHPIRSEAQIWVTHGHSWGGS